MLGKFPSSCRLVTKNIIFRSFSPPFAANPVNHWRFSSLMINRLTKLPQWHVSWGLRLFQEKKCPRVGKARLGLANKVPMPRLVNGIFISMPTSPSSRMDSLNWQLLPQLRPPILFALSTKFRGPTNNFPPSSIPSPLPASTPSQQRNLLRAPSSAKSS